MGDGMDRIRSIDADGNLYEGGQPIGPQPSCETHDPSSSGVCRRCLQLVSGVIHDRTPDFDAIAHRLATAVGRTDAGTLSDLAATLRDVWNARGAADAKAMADQRMLTSQKSLRDMVHSLDR